MHESFQFRAKQVETIQDFDALVKEMLEEDGISTNAVDLDSFFYQLIFRMTDFRSEQVEVDVLQFLLGLLVLEKKKIPVEEFIFWPKYWSTNTLAEITNLRVNNESSYLLEAITLFFRYAEK